MKTLIGSAFLVLTLSAGASAQDERSAVGQEVKDFPLTDNAGKEFRLTSLRRTGESKGEIAVLTFWCTTCHSCRGMEKGFDKKAAEYKEQGVRFLMVASNFRETADQVNRFLKANKLGFPVLMDPESEVARYFGATVTTTTAVIDAEGRLRYYGSWGKAEEAVRDLLDGKVVAAPETSPGG